MKDILQDTLNFPKRNDFSDLKESHLLQDTLHLKSDENTEK